MASACTIIKWTNVADTTTYVELLEFVSFVANIERKTSSPNPKKIANPPKEKPNKLGRIARLRSHQSL